VIDAEGAVLGRLASEVAKILRGKHKPIFAPHADTGDHVIVVNARRVRLTGGKEEKKVAYRHSGFPGGIRGIGYRRLMAERPATVVERAVRGMLPSNRLGRQMAKKLAVYEGPEHPHKAQRPQPLSLGQVPAWEGLPKPKPVPAPATPTPTEKKRSSRRGASAKAPTRKSVTARSTARRTGAGAATRARAAAGRTTAPKPKAAAKKRAGEAPAKKSGRGRRPKTTEES
jgi:large subunit ribosomal protein L13